MNRNRFVDFATTTATGNKQFVFSPHYSQSDYIHSTDVYDSTLTNVADGAMATIFDPLPGWANLDDCGLYPCTAPKNVLLNFKNTVFETITPSWAQSNFQVISNNAEFSPYVTPACTQNLGMNAYICTAENLGVLLFESEDDDRMDRSMQPIYVQKEGTAMANNLNAMMDHVWDGFYSGQKRMQRFPALFQGTPGAVYTLNHTGTPAKNYRFTIKALPAVGQTTTTGATIRIAYGGPEARAV